MKTPQDVADLFRIQIASPAMLVALELLLKLVKQERDSKLAAVDAMPATSALDREINQRIRSKAETLSDAIVIAEDAVNAAKGPRNIHIVKESA